MDIKARRTALGLSRKELAQRARVDASVLQLIELDQWHDEEAIAKVKAALDVAEGKGTNGAAENSGGTSPAAINPTPKSDTDA